MKKLILGLIILLPSLGFSVTTANMALAMQTSTAALQAKGLITPDSGIQLVPKSELNYPKEVKKKFALAGAQQNNIGYYRNFSARANELVKIDESIKEIKKLEVNMYKPYETHLRKSKDEMMMAYTFVGVPQSEITEYIGIAPAGMFVEKPIKGWSGAVEIFKTKFANCAYTENNLHISHGAARIAEEDATYEVNGKVTLKIIEGNKESGYLYRIKWFNADFIRELECGNTQYSKDTLELIINLAKAIDSA